MAVLVVPPVDRMDTTGVCPVQLMLLNWTVSTSEPQLLVAVIVRLLLPFIGFSPSSTKPVAAL